VGRLARALAALLVVASLAACAGDRGPAPVAPRGVHHELQRGETVYRLSRRYGVSVETILEANGIEDPQRIAVGTRLFIPGVDGPLESESEPEPLVRGCSPPDAVRRERQAEALQEDLRFEWPLRGRITTCFAPDERMHDGIDIAVTKGTAVRAAESGKVVYSSRLGAYGNLVVLRHGGAYTSLYAHNLVNLVDAGDAVVRGDVIAEVGDSGNATGPHLHFEIRRERRPDNPMLYLP
jgi:murein DD-endopeptidase MepM/ murein hydrolase activator NlpD